MSSDFEIGRVVAVDTAQVTVELKSDLKALTRVTYERTVEVGTINSYVILPVGVQRIVAMVTRIFLTEEAELRTDRTLVALPSARRLMKATMIGTIEGQDFTQGVSLFPVLDTPVLVATRKDLEAIFGAKTAGITPRDPSKPGYCIPIGKAAVFTDFNIHINPDAFFGKHAAVIGSTGSGKSCTIATIIQTILRHEPVRGTHFVILDTNGEYRQAFQKQDASGNWTDSYERYRCLYIPSDQGDSANRLVIPYWFMNADDFVRLFKAAPSVQRPVLLGALTEARERSVQEEAWRGLRRSLLTEVNRLLSLSRETDNRAPRSVRELCDESLTFLGEANNATALRELSERYPDLTAESLRSSFEAVKGIAREGIRQEGTTYESYAPLGISKRQRIESYLLPLIAQLASRGQPVPNTEQFVGADTPTYFSKTLFRGLHLDQAMSREETGTSRARENCATMLMRIHQLLDDKRYEFLFGPTDGEWPEPLHSLATFLRDILGLAPSGSRLSEEGVVRPRALPFYDRERRRAGYPHNVVVIDLSLLASEVLENVTALVGRLLLEFLQRIGETKPSGIQRGEFPVVLVLEEAQNYIREPRGQDEESISRRVFERIAREGRKYGLSLVVASQRPSELSKTVLSQCSSFIVHRLQNPEDLRYFREIVPGVYSELLAQLPALAPRYALVLGECVRAPALVYMNEARPLPRSKDPLFYAHWVAEKPSVPDVEAVCAKWEGRAAEVANSPATEQCPPERPEPSGT